MATAVSMTEGEDSDSSPPAHPWPSQSSMFEIDSYCFNCRAKKRGQQKFGPGFLHSVYTKQKCLHSKEWHSTYERYVMVKVSVFLKNNALTKYFESIFNATTTVL